MSLEEITRNQRLKIAIQDLDYAAAPTKSEVFLVCGGKAAELRDDLTALLAENERLREALKEIDAMPHYVAPIPENHLSSLHKRYERVLSIAEAALKDPDQ